MQMNEVRLPAKLFSVSLLYNILLCEGIFKQLVEPDVGAIFTQKYARIRDGMQRMKSNAMTQNKWLHAFAKLSGPTYQIKNLPKLRIKIIN